MVNAEARWVNCRTPHARESLRTSRCSRFPRRDSSDVPTSLSPAHEACPASFVPSSIYLNLFLFGLKLGLTAQNALLWAILWFCNFQFAVGARKTLVFRCRVAPRFIRIIYCRILHAGKHLCLSVFQREPHLRKKSPS